MKDLISSNISPIELAKRVINLKGLVDSNTDFEKIKEQLVPKPHWERVNQIIRGLEQEDEFAILCKIMGTCESLTKIDQNPIIESDEKAPDFLASFRPGCAVQGLRAQDINVSYNCFIEVKSCKNEKFRISEKDLASRNKFTQRFRLPLVFAIRFTLFENHCYWILIESKKLAEQGRKVEIDSSFTSSLSPVLFDDYFLLPHPDLHFIRYYDSNSPKNGRRHGHYGILSKTYMVLSDKKIFEIEDENSLLVNAVLDGIGLDTVQVKTERNITAVILTIGNKMCLLSDMVYQVNNLARKETGEPVYDATRIVSRLDSPNDKPKLITREMVEHAVLLLNLKEMVLFKIGIGEPKKQEKILRSLARKG